MTNLLYFILISYGLTQILVYGKIFNQIRPKHYFFHCSMCVGWWSGFIIWFISFNSKLLNFDNSIITGFLLACLSSGTSYALCMIFGDEGIRTEVRNIPNSK